MKPAGVAESARVSEVLAALSLALDLAEGQPFGHALRSCLIGMRLADAFTLPLAERRNLFYASLLKDAGCSSNAAAIHDWFGGDDRAAKRELKRGMISGTFFASRRALIHATPGATWFDRARRMARLARGGREAGIALVETRANNGAAIVRELGFGGTVASAVCSLDEHWDGHGYPRGLSQQEIPLLARILNLAQGLEIAAVIGGADAGLAVVRARRGTWFDPALVSALDGIEAELEGWLALDDWGLQNAVGEMEPGDASLLAGPGTLERIARAFATVVDAKSPYTARHSSRVTEISLAIASRLGMDESACHELGLASLLHDLGKLSVPNSVLDKASSLTADEWEVVRLHPYYTYRILERVGGLRPIAFAASAHHERLDGRGYFRGLRGDQIPALARVLSVADVYEALTSDRPYRPALPEDVALRMMERDRAIGFAPEMLDALVQVVGGEAPDAGESAA